MVIDINYWTKVIRKLLITIITIVLVYLGFKLAIFYFPFLIAFIISLLLEPLIRILMKKLKLKRKYSAIIIILFIMGLFIGLISWGISALISEGSNLLNNLNEYVEIITKNIQNIISNINLSKLNIPESVISSIEKSSKEMVNTIVEILQNVLKSRIEFYYFNSDNRNIFCNNIFIFILYMH